MAAKPKKQVDTNLAPQFEVLTNWLRVLYPLKNQFKILEYHIEFTMVDLNWVSFRLVVSYFMENKNNVLKQDDILSFKKLFHFGTTPEEAYKVIFDECQRLNINAPTPMTRWLKTKVEQAEMGYEWVAERKE